MSTGMRRSADRLRRTVVALLVSGLLAAACSHAMARTAPTSTMTTFAAPTPTSTVPTLTATGLPTQLAHRMGPIPESEFVGCADTTGAPSAKGEPVVVTGFEDRPSLLQRAADPAAPLLVVFHGQGDCIEALQSRSDLDDTAVTAGVSVLWLSGAPLPERSWNVTDGCCTPASSSEVDEYPYIETAVAAALSFRLAPVRVIAVGVSNGAAMAIAAACTRPDLFEGVVSVAGWAPIICPRAALSMLAVGGTDDQVIGPDMPSEIVSMWRSDVTDCPNEPVDETYFARTTSTWSGCTGGTVVRTVALEGVAHVWPKFDFYDVDDDIVRFARGEFS